MYTYVLYNGRYPRCYSGISRRVVVSPRDTPASGGISIEPLAIDYVSNKREIIRGDQSQVSRESTTPSRRSRSSTVANARFSTARNLPIRTAVAPEGARLRDLPRGRDLPHAATVPTVTSAEEIVIQNWV
ncbi:hypothetical protein ACS0PU_001028 [Formica fusca]